MEKASQDAVVAQARDYVRRRVRRLIGRFGFTVSDCEDMEQEVLIFIMGRMRLFDPERGSIEQFVSKAATSRIRNIVRDRIAKKRDVRMEVYSLDAKPEDPESDSPIDMIDARDVRPFGDDTAYYSADELDRMIIVDQAIDQLPPDLARLCRVLKRGNVSDAAEELGTSRKSVYRQIERVRALFCIWLAEDAR